jgi:hypothetical protein
MGTLNLLGFDSRMNLLLCAFEYAHWVSRQDTHTMGSIPAQDVLDQLDASTMCQMIKYAFDKMEVQFKKVYDWMCLSYFGAADNTEYIKHLLSGGRFSHGSGITELSNTTLSHRKFMRKVLSKRLAKELSLYHASSVPAPTDRAIQLY